MLVCTNCGRVADESDWDTKLETLNVIDGRLYQEAYTICPDCGSTDIAEAKQCDHCHEWFDPDMLIPVDVITKDDEGEWEDTIEVCRDCYDDDYFKPEDKCDGI